LAKDNRSLGLFSLKGIPPAPRGVPKIAVTFQLDVDGLLSVSAREETSGKEQSITIADASVLDRNEVSKMVEEAKENVVSDQVKKMFISFSYEVDFLLRQLELIEDNAISDKIKKTITKMIELVEDQYTEKTVSVFLLDTIQKLDSLNRLISITLLKQKLGTENKKGERKAGSVVDLND